MFTAHTELQRYTDTDRATAIRYTDYMTTAVSNLQETSWVWQLLATYFTTAPGVFIGYAMIYMVSLILVTVLAVRND